MPSIRVHPEPADEAVLRLTGLGVNFRTPGGTVRAVEALNLAVGAGECLGVVGESGAGKSQAFLAVMGLLAANGAAHGSARFLGRELLNLPHAALDRVRGAGIGMVFQDPMTSLTPHLTVGEQIAEVRVRHRGESWRQARTQALALLERVHISEPPLRLGQYPHELSGGLRQRVMIAIALATAPRLLIADEPTTALDVTVQAQILALLLELKRTHALAMILITHDLGAVAGLADRLVVMRAGRAIESGPVAAVLRAPREPYTGALVREAAALVEAPGSEPAAVPEAAVTLAVEALRVEFPLRGAAFARARTLRAVDGVGFELRAGEALAVVGESGSGKSTLARAALRLLPPSAGRVLWLGQPVQGLPQAQLRARRGQLQIIFQDPLASLDPRLRVTEIVSEGLKVHAPALDAAARAAAARAMLTRVGLGAEFAQRYPHELSGGQCQRVGIARAMILKPRVLVCDEPLSALDVSSQEQILTLLLELRRAEGLALLFISHNLATVRRLCDRALVMYRGHMLELAPVATLFSAARHPYSRALLAAIPSLDPRVQPGRLARARADEPVAAPAPAQGCPYRGRCEYAQGACAAPLAWETVAPGHALACRRWRELPPP
jgi:oligopeptide/dipeptide ABC transporter ATP-binding protein